MNANDQQLFRLFVYGTLIPGESNYRLIERHVRSARPGHIEGVLIDLGAFPALVAGDGIVRGVVLELDSEATAITDRLEGFHPGDDHSLYLRKEVMAQIDDGEQVTAWTYEFSDASNIEDRPRLVVSCQNSAFVYSWRTSADGSVDH